MTQWDNYRQSLRQHLANDNLDDFLQWSTIQATMFVGNAPYVEPEFLELTQNDYPIRLDNRISQVLTEVATGNPTLLWDWTSGNLIHQAYHLKQWLDRTKQDITQIQSIVEIGAGYGAMCLILRRLGFTGLYVIYDLPELVTIQQYYLSKTIGVENILWVEPLANGLATASLSCDLLIASHSLSEMPITERERLLSQVATKEYLFASSYEYEGVDNAAWFQQFAGSTVGVDWKFYEHPYQENAFYQVGVGL